MTRLFLLISLVLGLFLSINGTLLAATRTQATSPLEWLYYTYHDSNKEIHLYQSLLNASYHKRIKSGFPHPTLTPSTRRPWFIFMQHDDLYSMFQNSTGWRRLTHSPQHAEQVLGWSGEYLLFDEAGAIKRIHPQRGQSETLTLVASQHHLSYQWNKDGTWFFWTEIQPQSNTWHIVGQGFGQSTSRIFNLDLPQATLAKISADGESLYLHGDGADGLHGIYRVNLADASSTLLDPSATQDRYLSNESPDAQWLYYYQTRLDGDGYDLYITPSTNPHAARLMLESDERYPLSFSPDAQWILLLSRRNDTISLYRARVDASQLEPIPADYSVFSWINADEFILTQKNDRSLLYHMDSTGQINALPIPPVRHPIYLVRDGLIYRSRSQDYLHFSLSTGRHSPLAIPRNAEAYSFSHQSIPMTPTPTNALVAGFAMLSTSLIFAYKFQSRGLIKLR